MTDGNRFDSLREQVVQEHAPWLPLLEELQGQLDALSARIDELKPVQAGPAMSDVPCAREGCPNMLTAHQKAAGGRFCSIRCSTLANRPWLKNKGRAGGKNSPVTVIAGTGPRDKKDAEAIEEVYRD